MENKIVKEARGSIFFFNEEKDEWECVCYPFNKFFNATEPCGLITHIDWESARVMEKIDGSLIKFWYHNGKWHISTNGTIDAAKVIALEPYTFYDIVMRAMVDYKDFFSHLDIHYTYMFELTSPYNKIVIKYGDAPELWYLGRRNMKTFEEDNNDPGFLAYIRRPMLYKLYSLSECMAAAKKMDLSKEGFVVVDKYFNRIKIKGDAYLAAHRIRPNGVITIKRIVELWQQDKIDDFLAICPECKKFVGGVLMSINNLNNTLNYFVASTSSITDRKELARYICGFNPIIKRYVFAHRDGQVTSSISYLKQMRLPTLASYIYLTTNQKVYGIEDDI